MALSYGFFNAEMTPSGQYDRVYAAEQFAEYFHLIVSNGVFPDPATQLQVVASNTPDMNVNISEGYGWINGYFAKNSGPYPLALQAASGTLSRVDAVVLRWVNQSRSMEFAIKTGIASSSPTVPSLTRDEEVYEIMLASVTVAAGATNITQASITDRRPDISVCGWVTGAVQNIDTTDLFAQYTAAFNEWFENIKAQLGDNVATNLQRQIDELSDDKVNISDKATIQDAEAGTNDSKWMTPAMVKQAVGTAPETVQDLRTGELIRVHTKFSSVNAEGFKLLFTSSDYTNRSGNDNGPTTIYNDSTKEVYILTYTSSSSTPPGYNVHVYKGVVPSQANLSLLASLPIGSKYPYYYGIQSFGKYIYSEDNTLLVMYRYSNYYCVDFTSMEEVSFQTYYNQVFSIGDTIGYTYSDDNYMTLYYKDRSSSGSYSSLVLGYPPAGSRSGTTMLGSGHSLLWFIRPSVTEYAGSSYYVTQWQTTRVDFSSTTPTFMTGANVFTIGSRGWHSFRFITLGFDSDYAYALVVARYAYNTTEMISPKVFKFNLSSGSNNWDDITTVSEELYTETTGSWQLLGSIGSDVFGKSPGYLIKFNKETLNLTLIKCSADIFDYSRRIVSFNIPGLERFILNNSQLIDVDTGDVYYLKYGEGFNTINSNTFLTDLYQGKNSNAMALIGTVFHSSDCFGVTYPANSTTELPVLNGDPIQYKVVYEE